MVETLQIVTLISASAETWLAGTIAYKLSDYYDKVQTISIGLSALGLLMIVSSLSRACFAI